MKVYARKCAKSLQSYLTLCNTMDCSRPGSSVHGILQARTLEWVVISFSRAPSQPQERKYITKRTECGRQYMRRRKQFGNQNTSGDKCSPLSKHIWWWWCSRQVVFDSCDPMDRSLPGSPVHGILQARTLEWVVIPFSRGSSRPRDQTHIACSSCSVRHVFFSCSFMAEPGLFGEGLKLYCCITLLFVTSM